MIEHLDKVKFATTRSLTRLVIKALNDARVQIEAQAMRFVGAKLPPIEEQTPGIAERFTENLHRYFDEMTSLDARDEIAPDNYDNLSLVDHDYLEAMIAMEGMVKQMRDKEFKGVKSLITRLETMFPNTRIDETNNPLDPEQIGDCFNEAIRPLGLKAHYLLTIYREFNKTVFAAYDSIVDEANEVLVEIGVLPNLDITAEERERRKAQRAAARAQLEEELKAKQLAEEQANAARMRPKPVAAPAPEPVAPAPAAVQQSTPQSTPAPAAQQAAPSQLHSDMFAMMQTLVSNLAGKQNLGSSLPVSADATQDLAADQAQLRDQQQKLMAMLSDIQTKLAASNGSTDSSATAIGQSINQSLQAGQESGEISGIDRQSGDVINLVTMLYEAIWKDRALPVVMKELIGRTQITIMKVALNDTEFFDNENHPGRTLLNELALAGIGWTETDDPENDSEFISISQVVEKLLANQEPDPESLQVLVNEVRQIRAEQAGNDARLEQRVQQSTDLNSSMDDVNAYVRQKIHERVLKGYLDPAIRKLLDTHIHNFLVKLVLKEGPEGRSWKPVMNTIDVLLWTVQVDKQAGDRERFDRINPRLLDNLEKALEIGGASRTKITKAMRQVKQIQEYTFHKAEATEASRISSAEPASLPKDDPYMRRIDKMPLGTWIEFDNTRGERIRCALVSKIDSIDKVFFANKEGKKVAELSRTRLARELRIGTIKVISEGTLVNRALEEVINNLKNSSGNSPEQLGQGIATG